MRDSFAAGVCPQIDQAVTTASLGVDYITPKPADNKVQLSDQGLSFPRLQGAAKR
jgi:hypothetical protein